MLAIAQISLALLFAAPASPASGSTSKALVEARAKLARGDLDGVFFALDGKTFAPEEQETAAKILTSAARKSLDAKDPVFAFQFAQMALQAKPEDACALELAARAQVAQKQYSGAESFADKWIAVTGDAEAILLRAEVALSQADWERAAVLARSAQERELSDQQKRQADRIATTAEKEITSEAVARAELEKMDRELAEAQERAANEERSTGFVAAAVGGRNDDVIVYGFKGCGFCTKVKRWLEANSIPYAYKDILEDKEADAEMTKKKLKAGIKSGGVPLTDIRGTLIHGAKMAELEKVAREAGLLH